MYGKGLFKGLGITASRLWRPVETRQYPYVQPELPPTSRTFLAMKVDEEGNPACTACLTCQAGCPDAAIRIEKDPENNKRAVTFTVNSGRCTFCGLCVENCPFDALHFTGDFERATTEKGDLIYRLISEGRCTGEGEGEKGEP